MVGGEVFIMKIKCAAILKDGKAYTGRSHSQIVLNVREEKHINVYLDSKEGFLTDNGEFVDRRKAAKIAFKSGQIKEEVDCLFSYMLK